MHFSVSINSLTDRKVVMAATMEPRDYIKTLAHLFAIEDPRRRYEKTVEAFHQMLRAEQFDDATDLARDLYRGIHGEG